VISVGFPFADSLGALADYAHQRQVRWLFFSWPEYETRPRFGYLLDTTLHVPGLTVRHATPDARAVLYEIGPEFGTLSPEMKDQATLASHRARGGLAIDSAHVASWRVIATVAFHRGAYQEARTALRAVILSGSADVDALLLYGETCLQTNDPAEAGAAFDRAAQLEPTNPVARLGRGWSRLLMRRPDEAAELWRPVIDQANDPATLSRMIELYQSLGDVASANRARAALARLQAAR
jgi:tetratricopeptide (TPR) repeat protein